ncbi:MAG: amidohydrolase [Deltaproteobacteria bacterium]|nr:amidohydrolase [Deltaproteobacteria bacterium]
MSERSASPAEIRASLDHPVIDADGHLVEYAPVFDRYLKEAGIAEGFGSFARTANFDGSQLWQNQTPAERAAHRSFRGPWWGFPNDARDLATVTAPHLLHERLDELGIDFAVIYPSVGLQLPAQRDEKVRRMGCRAYNRYAKDLLEGLEDRLAPVAVIPTFTPQEALEELDYAVSELGMRGVLLAGFAARPFEGSGEHAYWIDGLGLDSLYDYDPVWRKVIDLKVSPTFHSSSMGWSGRRSTTNFSHNHMGAFAGANDATAKSLFFGGVFHRFPKLRAGFLEGGVAWALQMYTGLVEHFEKRGPKGLVSRDPRGLDGDLFDRLVSEHKGALEPVIDGWGTIFGQSGQTPDIVNDFEAAGIERVGDIVRQMTTNCFFGCEADDRLAGVAFDTNRLPGKKSLRAIFSSDIGHWDVTHMDQVLPEAYEHLEYGWMDKSQFRDFMCDNAVRLFCGANADFFEGTVVEAYAKGVDLNS